MKEPPHIKSNRLKTEHDVMAERGMSPDEWYGYSREDRAEMVAHLMIRRAVDAIYQYNRKLEKR